MHVKEEKDAKFKVISIINEENVPQNSYTKW